MSSFALKMIACIFMFIDHTGQIFYNGNSILNIIGRLAFPIFAFQITEGYIHTKDIKKYLLRLLILALVSQIPFMIMLERVGFTINTIATLLFGLISITIYNKNKILGIISLIILGIIAEFAHFDGGICCIFIIFNFYVFKDKKIIMTVFYILLVTCLFGSYLIEYTKNDNELLYSVIKYYLPYYVTTLSAILLIYTYNNKKGKKMKWFFYIFYPFHIILLLFIKYLIN